MATSKRRTPQGSRTSTRDLPARQRSRPGMVKGGADATTDLRSLVAKVEQNRVAKEQIRKTL